MICMFLVLVGSIIYNLYLMGELGSFEAQVRRLEARADTAERLAHILRGKKHQ